MSKQLAQLVAVLSKFLVKLPLIIVNDTSLVTKIDIQHDNNIFIIGCAAGLTFVGPHLEICIYYHICFMYLVLATKGMP